MRKAVVPALVAILGLLALLPLLLVTAALSDPARRRPAAMAAGPPTALEGEAPLAGRPVEGWTPRLRALVSAGAWERLDEELSAVRERHGDLYRRFEMGYLQGRAKAEAGDEVEARELLRPYAAEGHPFQDLALFHLAEIAERVGEKDEAARLREQLLEQAEATHREEAVADHLAFLAEQGDPSRLLSFAQRLGDRAGEPVRRQAEARAVEALVQRGQGGVAVERGLALIRQGGTDDAADRAFRALDRPELIDRMGPGDWLTMGEAARHHRHFDRATALLRRALAELPSQREDLLFAIGRTHFGGEEFAEAERAYLQGAAAADDVEARVNFLYHASRAAQLQGQDARAEGHLTRAIAAGQQAPPAPRGRGRRGRRRAPSVNSRVEVALTQRLRIRLAGKRFGEAESDLRQLHRVFPAGSGWADAGVAYASAMVIAGRESAALSTLRALPPRLLEGHDAAEVDYWTARALEKGDPDGAVGAYLRVLRADVPTHFAYLARRRLQGTPLAPRALAFAERRAAEAERRRAAGDLEAARGAQTDAVLLATPAAAGAALERLEAIYRELPDYRQVLELAPEPLPALPVTEVVPASAASSPSPSPPPSASEARRQANNRRLDLLLALGLFDDAVDIALERYPLAPPSAALTRAVVLNQAGATRGSVQAVEKMMSDVPDDYVPELLPAAVRQLLYPRYFYSSILEDARRHGADARLVLSIMREESRFDPRAKSAAAARGLLQFIITTAREVGRALGLVDLSPEDLYDPRIVIQLGAKYVGDLLREFGGDRYRAAAAYNAGPAQARLWARLAPSAEDDAYLSAINFDETKNYVRKVMNSYERYAEIYEAAGPVGGVEAQP